MNVSAGKLKPLAARELNAMRSHESQLKSSSRVSHTESWFSLACDESLNLKSLKTAQVPQAQREDLQWLATRTVLPTSEGLSAQPHITAGMRSLLYDWLMEVAAEYALKRPTLHLAVAYLDRSLSRLPVIPKSEFQLWGLAAISLAVKNEEIRIPRYDDWVALAENQYSKVQLQQTERALLKVLDWKINPSTVYHWLTWLMTQWDEYLLASAQDFPVEDLVLFKQPNKTSYRRFRELTQLLDAGTLHADFMTMKSSELAVGLLYLGICKHFYETGYAFFKADVVDELNYENEYHCAVQELFYQFMMTRTTVSDFSDLRLAVRFFHQFLDVPGHYDPPLICHAQSAKRLERHYEDFLSYHTYNCNLLSWLKD